MKFGRRCPPALVALLALVLFAVAVAARTRADQPARATPAIHVIPGDWGGAPPANVEAVLRSAADALLACVPDHGIALIHVGGGSGPVVFYQRAADGGYQVRLNTRDTYWAQYAFQFAHEVGHILCGYDAVQSGNHFLEESICEAASLFALRRMAETWKDRPPYPNWAGYAPHLRRYAQDRIDAAKLPPGQSLADWYRANADALRANATDREKNLVIAAALLPLFEADPTSAWSAVRRLNANEPAEPTPFDQHLRRWHAQTPEPHRPFVRQLAAAFGVKIDEPR